MTTTKTLTCTVAGTKMTISNPFESNTNVILSKKQTVFFFSVDGIRNPLFA
jgi:hypothetical protein